MIFRPFIFIYYLPCQDNFHIEKKYVDRYILLIVNELRIFTSHRFLVKAWELGEAGNPLTPTVSYLTNAFKSKKASWDSSPDGIIAAFQAVAAG